MRACSIRVFVVGVMLAASPAANRSSSQAGNAPPFADLLGASPDEAIEKHGRPHEVRRAAGALTFRYRRSGGGGIGEFVFHDDVALATPGNDFRPSEKLEIPAKGVWSGQSAAQAVRELGEPKRVLNSATGVTATYPSGTRVTYGDRTSAASLSGRSRSLHSPELCWQTSS